MSTTTSMTHPLLLDIILNKVFQSLAVDELLKCRLVCKCWLQNSALRRHLKKKSTVSLRDIFLHTGTTKDNLPDYFHLTDPIYENYNFANISYHNNFISAFFHVIGSTVKILKLQLDLNQLNIDHFRELIFERVPNLTDLNIYSLSHDEVFRKPLFPPWGPLPVLDTPRHVNLQRLEIQEIRTQISRFMTQFFDGLTNLREITLKTEVCSDWVNQGDLWRQNSPVATSIIIGLEKSGAFKTLKVLRCGKLLLKHIESLNEMGSKGLQLETLEVHMPLQNAVESFNAFLVTQQATLKQLIVFEQQGARYSYRLNINKRERAYELKIPDLMPKLELLQLSKSQKSVIVPLFPVDYARQCPSLNKLIFLGYPDRQCYEIFKTPTRQHFSLSELVLWNRISDPNIVRLLGNYFSLTKLTIRYPSLQLLKALWSTCDRIQSLCLLLEEGCYMDEAITGLPLNYINSWIDSSTSDTNEALGKMGYGEGQRETSIRNLKDLRSLKIVVDHDVSHDRQVLCDASAYFALKEMTQLRYLELFSSHWEMGLMDCQFFSQECCHLLRTHLDLTVIHFSPRENS